ncbi:MAG TPA: hypothetical protein VHW65_11085, partial [Gemmatimonadales bacterium]|nr:hypothetical protein [Gemmatimonadales bacterium]
IAANASNVTLDILDAGGKLVRHYTSDTKPRNPDPAVDPVAYNKVCQQTPNAADCSLPLNWPAPAVWLSTEHGMHRWSWDMHYEPLTEGGGGRGGGGSNGAVPHRTYPGVSSPWAVPGTYTVRLTVDGKSMTQPMTLHLDPRVKLTLGVTQLLTLTREMYDGARTAHDAATRARALDAALDQAKGDDIAAFKGKLDSLIGGPAGGAAAGGRGGRGAGGGGRGGRGGGAATTSTASPTLDGASTAMMAAASAMQAADVAPTGTEVEACTKSRGEFTAAMLKWNNFRTLGLAAFNARRKAAGESTITLPD